MFLFLHPPQSGSHGTRSDEIASYALHTIQEKHLQIAMCFVFVWLCLFQKCYFYFVRNCRGNAANAIVLPLCRPLQAPMQALAQSVLAEVPHQLVSYFKMRGLEPPKPQTAPKS